MPLDPPNFPGNIDSTNPRGTDSRTISDDVHRNTKESLRMTFANVTAAVTSTADDLNLLTGLGAGTSKLMTGEGGTTKMLFVNAAAPTGWTIDSAFDGRMLVTAGTIDGTVTAGADVGGSEDPGINDKIINHRHLIVDDFERLQSSETPSELDASSSIVRRWNIDPAASGKEYELNKRAGVAVEPTIGRSGQVTDIIGGGQVAVNYKPLFAATIVCTLDA